MDGFLLWVVFMAVLVGIAILPAWIAGRKGYSRFGFFVFGVFFWPIAVIVALVVKDKGGPREKAKPVQFGPQ